MTYATRRLQAGDVFEAKNSRDHKILLATRKVELASTRSIGRKTGPAPAVDPAPTLAAPPVEPAAPSAPQTAGAMTTADMPGASASTADDRAGLRAEYETVLGKAPFPGWSSEMLREKIAAARTPGS
jgi:hypothetical protein